MRNEAYDMAYQLVFEYGKGNIFKDDFYVDISKIPTEKIISLVKIMAENDIRFQRDYMDLLEEYRGDWNSIIKELLPCIEEIIQEETIRYIENMKCPLRYED